MSGTVPGPGARATTLLVAGGRVARAAATLLGGEEVALAEFPFLSDFAEAPDEAPPWAPLQRLAEAGGVDDPWLLPVVALGEEDARFGVLFEALQSLPGQHRPTAGLLDRLFPGSRAELRALLDLGLLRIVNPDAPRAEQAIEVPGALWDALSDGRAPSWARHTHAAAPLDTLLLDAATRRRASAIPAGDVTVVVRGPRRNGRGTLLAAIAAARGLGVMELDAPDEARLALAGPVATALGAMLVLRPDPAPGEAVRLSWPRCVQGPIGIVLPNHGGLDGPIAARTWTLRLTMPTVGERLALWSRFGPAEAATALARRYRLTTGAIVRAGRLAPGLDDADVREATRGLHREALDQLATPLDPVDTLADLVTEPELERDLRDLIRRCQHRERLPGAVGPALQALSPGVRALFAGPSGTGKTLAARVIAGQLGLDLYRLDLSAVVNKYIGETEKNLERVFAHAESLDVVLLLDEGDALMAKRTAVSSATDRYANLETNFLLQRLESFQGIVLVTTNAADRIDSAFARRMDVVLDFRAPEAAERLRIWARHLPAHDIPAAALDEVADLCRLSGGQIRNAAVHACLLALDAGRRPTIGDLRAAIVREYRKMGAPAPWGA